LLAKLHPIFEYLPVETMVFKNQQRYYQAINNSTNIADSAIFVEFMLGEILTTLKNRQGEPLQCLTTNSMSRAVNGVVSGVVKTVYDFIEQNPGCRKPQIAEKTEIPIKTVEKHITKLKAMNKIIFVGSPKSGGYYVKMDE
jgi:predicted HTH transcriptional regulator